MHDRSLKNTTCSPAFNCGRPIAVVRDGTRSNSRRSFLERSATTTDVGGGMVVTGTAVTEAIVDGR
ncbi:MAG: hypothetical protein ABEJ86_02090 [Halococcoides sp.]